MNWKVIMLDSLAELSSQGNSEGWKFDRDELHKKYQLLICLGSDY